MGSRLEQDFRVNADDHNDWVNPGIEGSNYDYRIIYNAAGCRARPEV